MGFPTPGTPAFWSFGARIVWLWQCPACGGRVMAGGYPSPKRITQEVANHQEKCGPSDPTPVATYLGVAA